jgi:uncharacterized protein (TIGR00730 family)
LAACEPGPMAGDAWLRVCVFCGSNVGASESFVTIARELGAGLAARGLALVYGGGNVGLMGVLADAALAHGGEVTGVIPRHLVEREVAHSGLSDLRIVDSMHQRKQSMADLSDAFIVLPGGLGTLEEFFEIWTWGQLGLHRKPYGLLNVAGYFDPLLAFLDHAVEERFVSNDHRALLRVADDPETLLHALDTHVPPPTPKWLDRKST